MQLLYRGTPYNANQQSIQNPSPPNGITEAKVRLIYRGHTYYYESQPQPVDEIDNADAPMITLMYRGQTYQRRSPVPQPYQASPAINWRWRLHTQG